MNFQLINGPTAAAREHREALVEAMAKDLLRFDAVGNSSDAIRSLFGHYNYTDIAMLVDDARAVAFQEIVAREISKL